MEPDDVVGWTPDEGLFADDHREEDGKRPIRFRELDAKTQLAIRKGELADQLAEALRRIESRLVERMGGQFERDLARCAGGALAAFDRLEKEESNDK